MANKIIIIIIIIMKKKKESPLPKTRIQQEENALLVMVVLGESVVSARVKKYFFALRTMRVTPNVFFSLAGKG